MTANRPVEQAVERAVDRVHAAADANWPALLVAAACLGLGLANWLGLALTVSWALSLAALVGAAVVLGGKARIGLLASVFLLVGLAWGTARMSALSTSVLAGRIGESGTARLVTTAPARRSSYAVRVPAEVRMFGSERVRERVLLVLPAGRAPPRGAVLEADVRLVEPRSSEGGFDERAWLARQGIHVVARGSTWRQVGRRGGIAGLGDRLRDRVEAAVSRGTSGLRRAVVLGVVLGEDEGLSGEVSRDFRAAGLYHLLAVSGQNVAFLVGGMMGLGWLLRLSRLWRELLVLWVIGAYVLAVGWQPSVVRAAVAGALASLAWMVSRPRDRWHFLSLGALVLLAWTPTTLLDPGFQLSFAAVASIFAGLPLVRHWTDGYPLPRRAADTLGVAFVCGLATAPIMIFDFGRAPVYTVPANALAEPAMPLVLGLGLLAAVVDPVAPGAGASLGWLAGWPAAWLSLVAHTIASLPSAQVGMWGAVALAGLLVALWAVLRTTAGGRAGVRPPVLMACGALVVVAGVGWWSFRPVPHWEGPVGLRITFLDVGQGDSALLETPTARVLVDEGPPEADVAGQLLRMGIHSLSAVVLTHPEQDHVGGAAAVLRRLRVGVILDPELAVTRPYYEEAMTVARARRIPIRVARTGAEFRVGGLVLRVLAPPDEGLPSDNPNDDAVVLIASYGETDVFLPADAESDATGDLPLRDIEVLKVAHHGSADPGLPEELRVLKPEIAVISVGRGNDYGHPTAETLAALAAVPDLAVYRTDLDGRVVVESDGTTLRVRTGG